MGAFVAVIFGFLLLTLVALVAAPFRRWAKVVPAAAPLAPLWAQLMLGGGVTLGAVRLAIASGFNGVAVTAALALASFGLSFVAELDRSRPRSRATALVGLAIFLPAGSALLGIAADSPLGSFLSVVFTPVAACLVRVFEAPSRRRARRGVAGYGVVVTYAVLTVGGIAIGLAGKLILQGALRQEDATAVLVGISLSAGLHACGLAEPDLRDVLARGRSAKAGSARPSGAELQGSPGTTPGAT